MNYQRLIKKNIRWFARYYKLVAVAVMITVAVITGSLVVGDSVRNTLVQRVYERLGNTETILFSFNSFLNEEIRQHPVFRDSEGVLLTNGFISRSGRLLPVMIWGMDDPAIERGKAMINPALSKELSYDTSDIVLRLPATGLVPSGSLFVTENYTTSMRLSFGGIKEPSQGGNRSLKNEQLLPLNIFVNREELAEVLEIEGKVNLVLSDKSITSAQLDEAWNYSISGLTVQTYEDFTEITSDRVFLQKEVVDIICRNNSQPNRLFSYLVNSIELNEESIPYSFATAVDSYKDIPLHKNEMILSDYAAKRLNAKVNDTIRLTYFTSRDLKTLFTDTVVLQVKQIVPLQEFLTDSTLSTDFPGLSDVESCTDWDSDLPINMDLITDEDERYWELYRNTPKAIIPYQAVAADWGNSFGVATAIRVENTDPDLNGLRSEMFGLQLIHPRESGLFAAMNGVDFSGLFLALGFFIIVSALMLMLIPLSAMLNERKPEILLLRAIGYSNKRIINKLWYESSPVVFISSFAGVILGLLYTVLVMWLLGNVWKGATHTEGFALFPSPLTIVSGLLTAVLISLVALRITLIRSLVINKLPVRLSKISLRKKRFQVSVATLMSVLIICLNILFIRSVTLFVVIGVILIATASVWGDFILSRNGATLRRGFNTNKLVWATMYANKKQVNLSFFTLAIGVFIVFSVGLNRKGFTDNNQLLAGTGGYTLWCESSVPVYHNLSTDAGKEKLALTSLTGEAQIIQGLRYSADEASCLNLNKVLRPSVLGIDMSALKESHFEVARNLYKVNRDSFFDRMQQTAGDVYPVLVDETVLMWSLGLSIGDTIHYEGNKGKKAVLQIAGTLDNSIFQGYILMDRTLFSEIWDEITGSEVMLVKVQEQEKEDTQLLLSRALHDYGIRVTSTADRLKEFNSVTDTYLTIFMTLGGLGLLLGIISFIIVVRKNLAVRRREIELYKTLGFPYQTIERALYLENLLVPLYAIATGVICSLVGASISIRNTSLWLWILAFVLTVLLILSIVIFVKRSVKTEILKFRVS